MHSTWPRFTCGKGGGVLGNGSQRLYCRSGGGGRQEGVKSAAEMEKKGVLLWRGRRSRSGGREEVRGGGWGWGVGG